MNETEGFPRLRLAADANGDGSVTAADASAWLVDLAMFPGDAALYCLVTYAPGVAAYFELDGGDYGGPFTLWASALLWLAALVVAGVAINLVRDLDRNLTAYLAGRYAESKRLLRIARRRLTAWATARLRARGEPALGLRVEPVILERVERAVLRCLTNIDDGAVLTIDEVATRVGCPARAIGSAHRRLIELHLIEAGRGAFDDREGLKITPAGQMYLIGS